MKNMPAQHSNIFFPPFELYTYLRTVYLFGQKYSFLAYFELVRIADVEEAKQLQANGIRVTCDKWNTCCRESPFI